MHNEISSKHQELRSRINGKLQACKAEADHHNGELNTIRTTIVKITSGMTAGDIVPLHERTRAHQHRLAQLRLEREALEVELEQVDSGKHPELAPLDSVDVSTQPNEGRDESQHTHVIASGLLIA